MASLVLSDCLGEKFSFRRIPLNDAGFTIDKYYRLGISDEVEATVKA
jgi:hypothetical protein